MTTSSAEHDSANEMDARGADRNDDGNAKPAQSQVAPIEKVGLQQLSRAVARAAAVDVLMEYASTGVPRRVDRQTANDDEQSALD